MNKKELARHIQKISKLKGSFTLRSGQTSHFYFDKYRFESDPKILNDIAFHLEKLIPKDIDFLGGLELGGIPLATALSLRTNIPCVFIRKEAKTYGTCALAEGQEILNKKIVLIEDVITTGGQVIMSASHLREKGAIVQHVLCVIHRSMHSQNEKLIKNHLELKSLFTLKDFENIQ